MITKEADRYLSDHLGKIATRGRSINPLSNGAKVVNSLISHASSIILAVPEVAVKQTMGYPVIALHAGAKNMA